MQGDSSAVVHKPSIAEKEYQAFFLEMLGPISLMLAILVCYFLSFQWDLAEELAFTNEEVRELSGPSARLLAKAKLDKKTRQVLVSSGDVVGLSAGITAYIVRILGTLEQKQKQNELTRKTHRVPSTASAPVATESASSTTNGYVGVDVAALANFGAHSVVQ